MVLRRGRGLSISFGIRTLAQQPGNPPQLSDSKSDIDDRVKDLRGKIDDLKWILTMILGAAGLFTIAQGAVAFFTAQTFVKQADDAVKRVQEVAIDAERRYPIFSRAEEARREAYRALVAAFSSEGLDWRDNLYDRMKLFDRQRLLSVERFIGLEFLEWAENDPDYPTNLRRLANFYSSKYVSEGSPSAGDRERSKYYLSLALKITGHKFWILNDLGLLFLEQSVPRRLAEAKELFERSLDQNGRQQRPLYNLAVIATYETPENWAESERLLESALKEKFWERTETPEPTCNVHYNLACTKARLNKFDQCWAELENAAEGGYVKKTTVSDDVKDATCDLYGIAASNPAKFEELRVRLSRNIERRIETPARSSLKERISKAWDALVGKA
jgi:hypothetical protein